MLQKKIKNILSKKGLSITKNRLKVLKVFIKSGKPLALKSIKSLSDYIDRVSLFRILSSFEENKIIHTINLNDGSTLYALCNQDCDSNEGSHSHKHIHFQCNDCNDVSCLSISDFPTLFVPDYIINDISINASGVCSSCK